MEPYYTCCRRHENARFFKRFSTGAATKMGSVWDPYVSSRWRRHRNVHSVVLAGGNMSVMVFVQDIATARHDQQHNPLLLFFH